MTSQLSIVDSDCRRALLSKQSIWPKDHHEKKEDEVEHLAIGGRHIIAADRLHDADANPAEQRTFDAAHATGTTITNALSTKFTPTLGNTENSGIMMQAAKPTSAEPPANVIRNILGTGMPISIAASLSWTVARIALPR